MLRNEVLRNEVMKLAKVSFQNFNMRAHSQDPFELIYFEILLSIGLSTMFKVRYLEIVNYQLL